MTDALDLVGFGSFQVRLLLICGACFMMDAIEVMLLSFLQRCVHDDWDLSGVAEATLSSVVFAGELLGAAMWGPVADRYGRRPAFLGAALTTAAFGLASAAAPSYAWLLACRGLVGVGVGGGMIPFDLMSELMPESHRGLSGTLIEYAWSVGSVFVASMAWLLLDSHGWRVLTAVCAVPLVVAVMMYPWLPESPRWLQLEGRDEEAAALIREAAAVNGAHVPDDFRLQPVPAARHDTSEGDVRELFKAGLRRTTLLVWTVWGLSGFGYYGVVLFMPSMVDSAEDDDDVQCRFDYPSLFVSSCAEVVGISVLALTITRFHKPTLLGVFYGVAALGIVAAAVDGAGLALQFGGALLARAAVMAATSATWIVTTEAYPTAVRATGHGAASAVARVGAFATSYWADAPLSSAVVTFGYASVTLVCAVVGAVLPSHSLDGADSGQSRDGGTAYVSPPPSSSTSEDRDRDRVALLKTEGQASA